jgi:alanine racemase
MTGVPAVWSAPAAMPRNAWLEIDLDALDHNLRAIASSVPPGTSVAAVVKADAYGHGLEAASRAFAAAGAALLCVATADEALALRAVLPSIPILVLYPPPMAAVDALADARVSIAVSSVEGARELLAGRASWARAGRSLRVHLEVETGLTRMGVPVERAATVAATLLAEPEIALAGIWSHLADAGDPGVARAQVAALETAVAALRGAGVPVPARHLAASGGLLVEGVPAYELVRPGLALYGVVPDGLAVAPARRAVADALRPAMRLVARPVRLMDVPAGTAVSYGGRWVADRPSRIATLPVGYGDGYLRTTGPGAEVLVRGRRAPVIGAIAMDALMVDVTEIGGVDERDEVVLLGAQGSERIDALELARRRTSITWEVLATMARRMTRVYHASAGTGGLRTLAGESLEVEGRATP